VSDAVLDQVRPLDPEIAEFLPSDLTGKVLSSHEAMKLLHEIARRAKQIK
jgi:hypothetical protein